MAHDDLRRRIAQQLVSLDMIRVDYIDGPLHPNDFAQDIDDFLQALDNLGYEIVRKPEPRGE